MPGDLVEVDNSAGQSTSQDGFSQVDPTDTEELIKALMCSDGGEENKKSKFLGYRASGFSIRESCRLTPVHEKSIFRWRREDPEFANREQRLPQLRKTLGMEFARLEFVRNFRYVLEKDYRVLKTAVTTPQLLTKDDQAYLLKLRGFYTPQQLDTINRIASSNEQPSGSFNYTKVLLEMSREHVTIRREVVDQG